MSDANASQLEAIHSMLSAGHRSIRMARHSLVLWGVTGAALCLTAEIAVTPERFPVVWQRMTALLLLLGIVLSGAAVVDFNFTRYRLQARDESFSFVHAQVTKVWWLLIALGVLITFGTGFFGGGYMVFGIWLALFGLGLYIHGLFSEQMLEWVGVMMILLGVGALALHLPYAATKWLAASVFGLGMPLLTTMLDGGKSKGVVRRLAQTAAWLLLVAAPPAFGFQYLNSFTAPAVPAVPLQAFLQQGRGSALQVVSIPAGTAIPLKVRLDGDMLLQPGTATVPLTLAQPLEVALSDGRPDGRFRFAGEPWQKFTLHIDELKLEAEISPGNGAAASARMHMKIEK